MIIETNENPFAKLMSEITNSHKNEEQTFMQIEPRQMNIFDDWCVHIMNIIHKHIQNKQTRIDAVQELARNLQSVYGLDEPQELIEKHHQKLNDNTKQELKQVQQLHTNIMGQISELLATYLAGKLELDTTVVTTYTWIEDMEQKYKLIQDQSLIMQEQLKAQGIGKIQNNPFIDRLKQNVDATQQIRNIYEDNFKQKRQIFQEKQAEIHTIMQKALKVLPKKIEFVQNHSIIRDMLVFDSNNNSRSTEFRFQSEEQKIASFKVHYARGIWGMSGFEIVFEDGQKSELFGKTGEPNHQPSVTNILLEGLKNIRIQASNYYVYQMQFLSAGGTQTVYSRNQGPWMDYQLAENEAIIGLFGQVYDDFYSLKKLGFIIGKVK